YLERFRKSGVADDLTNARDRLRRLDPQRFGARERVEFLVGIGQTLFFDEAFGAAADVFTSVLARDGTLPAEARERVLDWWASALAGSHSRPRQCARTGNASKSGGRNDVQTRLLASLRGVAPQFFSRLPQRGFHGVSSANQLGFKKPEFIRVLRQVREVGDTREKGKNWHRRRRALTESAGRRVKPRRERGRDANEQAIARRDRTRRPARRLLVEFRCDAFEARGCLPC